MGKKKKKVPSKKRKKRKGAKDVEFEPEVVAFANWFADWWLRRGLRLAETAEKACPDYRKKEKRARRIEKPLPTHWNDDHTLLMLDESERDRGSVRRNAAHERLGENARVMAQRRQRSSHLIKPDGQPFSSEEIAALAEELGALADEDRVRAYYPLVS